ncbi:MAG TPA: heme-binding domain-containing protein [bacterium]
MQAVAIAAIGLVSAAWIAGEALIQRTNPPRRYPGVVLSAEADPLLKRACFDCHSNETRYPWYSHLPLASLRIALHVRQGRAEFSFSEWDTAAKDDKMDTLEESVKAIRKGAMPPWDYRLLHPEARLTAADVAAIDQAVVVVRDAMVSGAADSHSNGGRR